MCQSAQHHDRSARSRAPPAGTHKQTTRSHRFQFGSEKDRANDRRKSRCLTKSTARRKRLGGTHDGDDDRPESKQNSFYQQAKTVIYSWGESPGDRVDGGRAEQQTVTRSKTRLSLPLLFFYRSHSDGSKTREPGKAGRSTPLTFRWF